MIEWRDVVGYEGFYQVSNKGDVRSVDRTCIDGRKRSGNLRKLTVHKSGYLRVDLRNGTKQKIYLVHRLVAEAFIPNPENKPYIDHINTIKDDNRVENLCWVTRKENNNNILTRKHLSESLSGEKNPMYGKHHNEEQKEYMRRIMSGSNNYFYGKHHNEETKQYLSQLRQKSVIMYDKEMNYIREYKSAFDVATELGVSSSAIQKCCCGKLNSVKNYIFKYKE